MRSFTLISSLSLILPSFALVAYQPCLTTTALPMVTVKGGPDGYYTECTRTYREFTPQGLTTKIYTVTQTCSNLDCQTPPIETAPPPGFTAAVVKCSDCGGQGTQVATLTFPTESVEAYSSSGYVVEPLSPVQATKGWMDHFNSPPAVETVNVNGDTGMNVENISPTPGSSDYTWSAPQGSQVPSNEGSQQGQNSNESFGDTSSHHAATEDTGSASGDGSSDSQNAGSLDGTSSAKGWQSGETGNTPGSGSNAGDTPAGSIPQQGSPSSSSSSSYDATGSQEQGQNTPGDSNDPTGNTQGDAPASGIASVDGEPITNTNNKPDDAANTTSPDGVNGTSGDTSVSPDNNSGPPSSQNNSPPVVDSDSKHAGNDDDSQGPDAPFTTGPRPLAGRPK
ncbi:hypothetical protein FPOAC1_002453 [Fusarium poae]|uniref:hypothetical protein n=1 Tax=Fusarium poae TaxID=36050 RepID=UPI001CEA8689|nr:hypothetical protein FPOAC1_002453 [Fusarium poae]KAG8676449.1 hypothetical protein FPOAC1_002453 [Fusarium poae]